MDSDFFSHVLLGIIGVITLVGAVGVVGALFSMGRHSGYDKH